MRDAAINLRARPEQRDLIDQAAQALGKNRSDFMLEAACDRARSVLLDQVFFALDASRHRRFMVQLDAPAVPNEGLERLMAVVPPWQPGASPAASRRANAAKDLKGVKDAKGGRDANTAQARSLPRAGKDRRL